jgi:hypothetical protein
MVHRRILFHHIQYLTGFSRSEVAFHLACLIRRRDVHTNDKKSYSVTEKISGELAVAYQKLNAVKLSDFLCSITPRWHYKL